MNIHAEETIDWEFLPSLERVAAAGTGYRDGVPVFDSGTGLISYRIDNVKESHGLTAVPSTGEFIVAGRDVEPVGEYSLTVVDGLTGVTKRTRKIEPWPVNSEVDGKRGTIYVLHLPVIGDGFLGIYDKATLDLVGRVDLPGVRFWDAELVQDDSSLFAVLGSSDQDGTVVHSLRLLPEITQ